MTFQGKVVLITGASSGIGAATAVKFAKLGASLALTGRNLTNLEKVAANCKKVSSTDPFLYKAESTNETDTKDLIESVLNHYKRLDVLVNNAGKLVLGGIENTSLSQYDAMFNTNVRPVYHLTTLAVPYLIETKGSIVNVSSIYGLRAYVNALAYSMSKSALDQFTKCVAMELGPKGVRVNSVNPGVIVTELHQRAGMDDASYVNFLERCKLNHPLGRTGTPEEVAESIAFLAGDASSFTTGVNFPVDGGRYAFAFK